MTNNRLIDHELIAKIPNSYKIILIPDIIPVFHICFCKL